MTFTEHVYVKQIQNKMLYYVSFSSALILGTNFTDYVEERNPVID